MRRVICHFHTNFYFFLFFLLTVSFLLLLGFGAKILIICNVKGIGPFFTIKITNRMVFYLVNKASDISARLLNQFWNSVARPAMWSVSNPGASSNF